ncbi:GNAT family N-acetyltransferase [Citreicella sp. C3M06]|uniref:GNAT family N-acetyltransferase n=1 Tax=Citreicella sp. C3M06 TaxID=2841564 RepID=UPI001C085024|nr:GNAT family N-acetyltransferase [Citreicella sp. C3M06]MBU2961879.1 GNAT family N-acetyltransferase [Citreicella sp. C3M06]
MTQRPIEIRPYQADDNAALSDIWLAASRIAHAFLGEEKLLEHRALVSEFYLPQAETWVACLDGRPIGFIGLIDTTIGGIFVSPERQGMGVGQALIAHGMSLKPRLTLEVYALNERTRAFYEKLGFIEICRRPVDDEGLPFEQISMALSK